ncbi:tetratricopeptide repeat protein [Kitasatospora sp. NPDC004289]
MFRVEVVDSDVDVFRYRRAVTGLTGDGDQESRAELRTWLEGWGEAPLDGLPETFDRWRRSLDDEHREGWARWLHAELRVGAAEEVAAQMGWLRTRWPSDESLFEVELRLMGEDRTRIRQAYSAWPDVPSQRLEAVYRELTAVRSASLVQRQLPFVAPDPVGVQEVHRQLDDLLLVRKARLAVLVGPGGVGKTTAAASWGGRIEDQEFPDGTLYADLQGFTANGEPLDAAQVLPRFLHDLGVDPASRSLEGMVGSYRSALARRAVLVVLDNAVSADQVRPLLPGGQSCATLVVSRRRLRGLVAQRAQLVEVAPLTPGRAVELLARPLDPGVVRRNGPLLAELAERCDRLPLALSVLASGFHGIGDPGLQGLARSMRAPGRRLDSLEIAGESTGVRAALQSTHRRLSHPAQQLYWRLGVHPGPSAGLHALTGLTPEGERPGVAAAARELKDLHLLSCPKYDRFELHDLVRDHAVELAGLRTPEERRSVLERLLELSLQQVWWCDRQLVPGRSLPIGTPPVGLEPVEVLGAGRAMAWFDREYPGLQELIRLAREEGLSRYAWLLSMALVTYQWRRNRHGDAVQNLERVGQMADSEATLAEQATTMRLLAGSRRGLGEGQYSLAKTNLARAIKLSKDGGDAIGEAFGLKAMAILQSEHGELQEALTSFERTVATFNQLGNPVAEAGARSGLGSVWGRLGQPGKAVDYLESAVALFSTTTDTNGLADALVQLGRISAEQGDHRGAAEWFAEAAERYQALSYTRNEARTRVLLGEALLAAGDRGGAVEPLRRGEELFRRLGLAEQAKEMAERLAALEGEG